MDRAPHFETGGARRLSTPATPIQELPLRLAVVA
jgi:hypothetical protein